MYIKKTNSTNTLMRDLIAQGEKVPFIRTDYQTAGRGQSGNGWESEEGKNLLCSILIEKNIPAIQQFDINVQVTVALHRLIVDSLPNTKTVTIKWPNDMYVNDQKIAGVLIETALMGRQVQWAIAGIGLNINQTRWVSGAPNPTSILIENPCTESELDDWMNNILLSIKEVNTWDREQQWSYYLKHLYRREGYWPFVERDVTIAPTMNADKNIEGTFMARIHTVTPQGQLVLIDENNMQRTYHFKQVRYVL